MDEAQRIELEKIRDEQTALAGRMSRLETRLRNLEADLAAEPAGLVLPPVSMQKPPPMPAPIVPVLVPPPLPPEALAVATELPPSPPVMPPPPPAPAVAAPKESLEVRIGTTWLVRIGVVLLLTSLTFLGSYLYNNIVPHLGPAAKVALLYLGAGALTGVGVWLERRRETAESPRMLNFARVVLAGGLAAVYYVTYAAHWNPSLLVLSDPLLDGALLLGWTAFMVWLADRRDSETLATFAILLAFYTSAINEKAAFTLFANLLLAAAAVFLLRRHLWRVFPFASLAATYGSDWYWSFFHAYVRRRMEGTGSSHALEGHGGMWIEGGFLLIFWLLFTATVFAPGVGGLPERRRAWFASVNNAAFFALTTWLLLGEYPGAFWKWSLGFGAVLCVLAEASRWRRLGRETEGAYLIGGLLLITAGLVAYFDGWQLALALALQSVVLLGRAHLREERLPLWLSLASAVAVLATAANQFLDGQAATPWISSGGAGALLLFAAWWSQRRLDRYVGPPAAGTWPDYRGTLAAAPAFYAFIASGVWLGTVERTLAHQIALVPALAAGAAVLTASVYILGVRAVPFYAQGFLLAAYFHRFAEDVFHDGPTAPAWSLVALLLVTLVVGQWWQLRWPGTRSALPPSSRTGTTLGGWNAFLAVMLIWDWLRLGLEGPAPLGWIAAAAGLSLALLVYGFWSGYRALGLAGQILLGVSIVTCVERIWIIPYPAGFHAEMVWTLAPLLALLATIFLVGRARAATRDARLLAWIVVCEAVATLFFLGWGTRYAPREEWFALFGVAGALVFAWTLVRGEPRRYAWGGVLTVVGVASLALLDREDRAAFLHLVGIAALAGQQRFARRCEKQVPAPSPALPPVVHGVLMGGAVLCAWVGLSARVSVSLGGTFTLAAAWSLFAAVVFAAGLALHEKIYRWLGLGVLVLTLGRIAAVDVWQLDGLGRAVSALCLGVVLLGIGYLYNRFHSKWHGLF